MFNHYEWASTTILQEISRSVQIEIFLNYIIVNQRDELFKSREINLNVGMRGREEFFHLDDHIHKNPLLQSPLH